MKKRAVSPVIATVLTILITVIIAGLVAIFAVPFVQKNLAESKKCFDVLGDLSFAATAYNCNYINDTQSSSIPPPPAIHRTAFSVKIEGEEIKGFSVSLEKEGFANSYKILNGAIFSNMGMLNSSFNLALEAPIEGGVRTYVADDSYTGIELYPILSSGDICDQADSIIISPCLDVSVKQKLQNYG